MTFISIPLVVLLLLPWCVAAGGRHQTEFLRACRANDPVAARAAYVAGGGAGGSVDVDAREAGSGQSALMASVLAGADRSVRMLLSDEFGADASVAEKDGYTPMHGAGFQGRAAIASLLLKHGLAADDVHSGDGLTPLWRTTWGREKRHFDTAKTLIQEGKANVNFVTANAHAGQPHNPLTSAVQRHHIRVIELLLKNGADANVANPVDGNTALHFALNLGGHPELVKILIELGGADPNIKNNVGESGRDLMKKMKMDM